MTYKIRNSNIIRRCFICESSIIPGEMYYNNLGTSMLSNSLCVPCYLEWDDKKCRLGDISRSKIPLILNEPAAPSPPG